MKKIWITGAGGLIGHHLVKTAPPDIAPIGLARRDLDLADFDSVRSRFQQDCPDAIIHCAALSKTPQCEVDPPLARKLNVEVTAMLAELAQKIPFLFFSTDLVFDGRAGAYDESAQVNPLNVYAQTKVAAEKIVLCNPRHSVIRTSLNAGASPTGDRSISEQIRRAFETGKILTLFMDEFRAPIHAGVTARATWELLATDQPGLYHVAGAERLSRYQLGQLFAARWPHLNPRIEAESIKDFKGPARSPNVFLDSSKAQQLLSFQLPRFSEWLAANLNEAL